MHICARARPLLWPSVLLILSTHNLMATYNHGALLVQLPWGLRWWLGVQGSGPEGAERGLVDADGAHHSSQAAGCRQVQVAYLHVAGGSATFHW